MGRAVFRIIPAYAGSTATKAKNTPFRRDHPRIRGEHAAHGPEIRGRRGSSPHTRGAPPSDPSCIPNKRIIPAYAGSTGRIWCAAATTRDHPRIRGEHSICLKFCHLTMGSSPHTRGARTPSSFAGSLCRIIPAYAGSTPVVPLPGATLADHPRIRGEHKPAMAGPMRAAGIIPAYAGSTKISTRRA